MYTYTNILFYIILNLVNIILLFITKGGFPEKFELVTYVLYERNRQRKRYTLNLIAYVSAVSIAIFLPVRNYGNGKKLPARMAGKRLR